MGISYSCPLGMPYRTGMLNGPGCCCLCSSLKGMEIDRVKAHITVATVQEATATVVAPAPTHPQSY